MCNHGDTVMLCVNIPAHLSHTGAARWDMKAVDRCIAPLVEALNAAGILTASSCCGHGETDGEIMLQDGRTLRIGAATCDALRAENARLREAADDGAKLVEQLGAALLQMPGGMRKGNDIETIRALVHTMREREAERDALRAFLRDDVLPRYVEMLDALGLGRDSVVLDRARAFLTSPQGGR